MNSKNRKQSPNNRHLGALAAISASVILAVFGLWYVIGTLQPKPDTWPPTATAVAATAPFVTKVVTVVPPTSTPVPPTETPAPTPPQDVPLALAVVHSNDTWGYTQPCG